MALHIGTSGWSYEHWQGVLYPHGIPQRDRLEHYIRRFRTVEVNSTFYRWPGEATFKSWYRRTPDAFLMTVKAPRGLTHHARLYAPERWVETIRRGLDRLSHKRGVLLVQLPPGMACDCARLDYFLRAMPREIRVAVEFRHPSWHCEEVFRILEGRGAAYCVMSGANLPCILRATAAFVCIRLHGPDSAYLYAGSYSDDSLHWWAWRIREWQGMGLDAFAYFNNDGWGHAVRNAAKLREILEGISAARESELVLPFA
jgi:uncharacterized protein YecE (DUF72 family)